MIRLEVVSSLDSAEIRSAPDKMSRLVKQEMLRHAKRFRKAFVKELRGIDLEKGGIKAMVRNKAIGKVMTSFVRGQDFNDLLIHSKAGGLIFPYLTGQVTSDRPVLFKSVKKFFVRTRTKVLSFPWVENDEEKRLRKYSFTPTVTLPFQNTWDSMEPALIERIEKAIQRALDSSFSLNARKAKNA